MKVKLKHPCSEYGPFNLLEDGSVVVSFSEPSTVGMIRHNHHITGTVLKYLGFTIVPFEEPILVTREMFNQSCTIISSRDNFDFKKAEILRDDTWDKLYALAKEKK